MAYSNQTRHGEKHEPQRLVRLESSVSCEERGDAQRALKKCFSKN